VGRACVSGREKPLYAGFQVGRWLRKPCPVEFAHVCLREVLALPAQGSRHVNIPDAGWAPQRGTNSQDHIVKGAYVPGPAIKETTHVGVLP
jgi:hypothetical protein